VVALPRQLLCPGQSPLPHLPRPLQKKRCATPICWSRS
jgi:hypothetical protein